MQRWAVIERGLKRLICVLRILINGHKRLKAWLAISMLTTGWTNTWSHSFICCEQKSILIWFAHVRCWCLPVSACLYLSQPVSTWLYLSLPVSTHLYPSLPVYTCLSLSLPVLTCLLALTHWSESPTLSWWNGKVRITLQGVHVCIIGPHNAELAVSPLILPLSITRISQGLFE